jgi:hypothetical protein
VDPRFTALAGDVILRLGHLLFVLYLTEGPVGHSADSGGGPGEHERGQPHRSLALDCVRRAWQLDRHRALAASDLLKLHFRTMRDFGEAPPELERALKHPIPIDTTWPGGANGGEGMSRAIEYMLLQQLRLAPPVSKPDETVARGLLHSLLSHTDSIEARKSHVYDYLTRPPTRTRLPAYDSRPAIEFVCLRRYSSAYPILPSPQAFRSHGGGYFVRIHPAGGAGRAFGIAVDPGTSYVECLYRAGFSLADVDMIVVTHDHVDHASSLEPLLALRHEMRALRAHRPLIVLGNRSVVDRWESIATYSNDTSLSFVCLDAPDASIARLDRLVSDRVDALRGKNTPARKTLVKLTPLTSELGGRGGHCDLAGNPSYGVLLTLQDGEDERTLTITSDLPAIPPQLDCTPAWQRAFQSDVFICHLSTIPLTELRQMAGLLTPENEVLREDIAWINANWNSNKAMRARLTYAYWLKGARPAAGRKRTRVKPVGDDERLAKWIVPETHPYLGGILNVAREVERSGSPHTPHRLFVVGELSEELGSFRARIAWQLNRHVFNSTACRALTGDIGLRIVLGVGPPELTRSEVIEPVCVLCSTCELDNDLAPVERYHRPDRIYEVCVKGENEGIFYNCPEHDPAARSGDPIFLEKLERYDLFGR